jgi:hypothetical protein
MDLRHHVKGDAASTATYSPCQTYRYLLTRRWSRGGLALFVMLNPSTATETRNDPTVERCERRARRMGFGGFGVVNIFALRATDPKALYHAADPVGPGNDEAILAATASADCIICGWGTHGALHDRGAAVRRLLTRARLPLWHLGLTRAGEPRHPLYVGYARQPEPWAQA